jgi:uncharacterized protein YcbK (DUF882 family)
LVSEWKEKTMTTITRVSDLRYFVLDEFKCPCCGQALMNLDTLSRLDKARHIAGTPFKILSGYRCKKHNKEVGGKDDSAHLKGTAADIACLTPRERYRILMGLFSVGFNRIGIYPKRGFIHVDTDKTKDFEVVWVRD